jgi:ferric-dicitrate binding protein FerR (iron transport regulator)
MSHRNYIASFLAVASLLAHGHALAAGSDMGAAVIVVGEASITAGDRRTPLAIGMRVSSGDIVRTAAKGRVQLLLADSSLVNIGPSSELRLATLRASGGPGSGVSLKLVVGKMWARVSHLLGSNPDFSVDSGNAVAGVRGTSFFTGVDADGTSETTVIRGRVELENRLGQKIFVGPMQRGIARAGGTSLVTVTPEVIQQLTTEVGTQSWSDPGRMQGVWEQARAASDTVGDDKSGERVAVRETLGGTKSQMDSLNIATGGLNLAPRSTDAVIHGRVTPGAP